MAKNKANNKAKNIVKKYERVFNRAGNGACKYQGVIIKLNWYLLESLILI